MKFIDLSGQKVSKDKIAGEKDYFLSDKRRRVIPATMTFSAYVAKYLGWKPAGRAS